MLSGKIVIIGRFGIDVISLAIREGVFRRLLEFEAQAAWSRPESPSGAQVFRQDLSRASAKPSPMLKTVLTSRMMCWPVRCGGDCPSSRSGQAGRSPGPQLSCLEIISQTCRSSARCQGRRCVPSIPSRGSAKMFLSACLPRQPDKAAPTERHGDDLLAHNSMGQHLLQHLTYLCPAHSN